MEKRKLTKEDIDKVRDIEGFPIGSDEDIIALSDAPYYTACPNPFIEEFIKEYGTPYDEATDDYHREPFAADVSEGKYDPLYKLHAYPTKVPHKAIRKFIEYYTKPGDIVFDGFCGTGMTGVAAQTCKERRNVLLSDLSPTATYIASVYNSPKNIFKISKAMEEILQQTRSELGWMYETEVNNDGMMPTLEHGIINYVVWSKVLICPNCGERMNMWNRTIDYDFNRAIGNVIKNPTCPKCGLFIDGAKCLVETELVYKHGSVKEKQKFVPVLINYTFKGRRYEKVPNETDLKLCSRIKDHKISHWYPYNLMMNKGEKWGDSYRAGYHKGVSTVDDFFTHRTMAIYSYMWWLISQQDPEIQNDLRFICTACFNRTSRMVRYMAQYREKNVGPLSGTLYLPPVFGEINVIENVSDRLKKWREAFSAEESLIGGPNSACITTQSTTAIVLPENSIDYIFVDPPFGDNLMYSELNFLIDAWLRVCENICGEAIVNESQSKFSQQYKELMKQAFACMYRALKPNRWITVEFHNSKNLIWNILQEALISAGFIIADVRTLDKKKGTSKQMIYTSSVKQDLVISAYKPKDSFRREITEKAGSEETAWAFVNQHLENIPVVNIRNGKIEIVAERQAYLLFDRMVAYHIMQGIPVPLDATDFYKGLDERFIKRDNMYFLPDQVNEYDTARIKNDVEHVEFSLFVTNEKSAIAWLYQQLDAETGAPQTYAEIQPKFMQEVKKIDRYEALPELSVLLEENFIQDENGRWYVPDVTKEGDIAKLREKKLWKEFEGYMNSKGKLKSFRSEAIRAGFSRLWKEKNYRAIVDIAERLPESIVQEDPNLLMYYDISLGRV